MWIFLDIALVLIITLFVIISAKKGFMLTFMEAVCFLGIAILSFTVSSPISNGIYDKIIEPKVITEIAESADISASDFTDSILEDIPDILKPLSKTLKPEIEKFKQNADEKLEAETTETAVKISGEIIKPITVRILSAIISLLIWVIGLLIIKPLSRGVNKLFSFSLVGKINRFLGGVIGFIRGLVLVTFILIAFYLLLSFTQNGFWIFTRDLIEKSILYSIFAEYFPFYI